MRAPEPLEPEVAIALEAIDATLEGEPVAPELAELAELALLLRAQAPEPDPAFVRRLDARAAERFAPAARRRGPAPRLAGGMWSAGAALAGVGLLVLVVVVVVGRPGGGSSSGSGSRRANPVARSVVTSGSATTATSGAAAAAAPASGSGSSARASSHGSAAGAPAPRTGRGRDLAQSARIALSASPGAIDRVAQEVYDAVGAEHGFVLRSSVLARAGAAGSATFALSVPSARLGATLDRLSGLSGAHVASREDASADVTGRIDTAGGALATARALHSSLLRRLAAATSTTEVDRLSAALRRNAATIARDAASLQRLRGRVSRSGIDVTVSAPAPGRRAAHRAAGFTLRGAVHDAGRVLEVAAGVALIGLAVLVPVALSVALLGWLWTLARRRRREAALGP